MEKNLKHYSIKEYKKTYLKEQEKKLHELSMKKIVKSLYKKKQKGENKNKVDMFGQ